MAESFSMTSPLLSLDQNEWEALCDGCGRCCLVKLEDEDTGKVHYTNVACRFLDTETCRCTDYANRCTIQPDCVKLSPDNLSLLEIMPSTCIMFWVQFYIDHALTEVVFYIIKYFLLACLKF